MDIIDLTVEEECDDVTTAYLIEQYFKERTKSQLPIRSKVTKTWLRKQGKTKLIQS